MAMLTLLSQLLETMHNAQCTIPPFFTFSIVCCNTPSDNLFALIRCGQLLTINVSSPSEGNQLPFVSHDRWFGILPSWGWTTGRQRTIGFHSHVANRFRQLDIESSPECVLPALPFNAESDLLECSMQIFSGFRLAM
jgi:hypothetical protein